jgi:hypothetical protein
VAAVVDIVLGVVKVASLSPSYLPPRAARRRRRRRRPTPRRRKVALRCCVVRQGRSGVNPFPRWSRPILHRRPARFNLNRHLNLFRLSMLKLRRVNTCFDLPCLVHRPIIRGCKGWLERVGGSVTV